MIIYQYKKYWDVGMRKEIRYSINYVDYKRILTLLKITMAKDKNAKEDGTYKIKTIYFDNYNKEIAIKKKLDINDVRKYRIRMYNDDDKNIFLERKTNVNGYILKKKEGIKKETVQNIIKGDIKELLEEEANLKTELYLNMNLKQIRPIFILQYERTAFTDEISKTRITIDKNIQSTTNCSKYFEDIEGPYNDKYILEIKYETYIPDYIKSIMTSINGKQVTKSKFRNVTRKWGI